MDFLDDPEEMTPEERLAEVAAILAAGYQRHLQSCKQLAPGSDSAPFTEKPLDCSGQPRPLWVQGLTGRDPGPGEGSA